MQNELNLKILFENMIEGVTLRDRNHAVISYNLATLKILGLTAEQFENRAAIDPAWKIIKDDGSIFPPEEYPSILVLKTGVIKKNVEMGIVHKNGNTCWISVNATPIFNDTDPLPIQVISTFKDITERVKLTNALKKNESKFRALFEHSPIGMIELDENRRYVEVNHAFLEMTGYSTDDLKKMTMFDITHPDDLVISKKSSELFSDPYFFLKKLQKRYITKDGKTIWAKISSRSFEVEPNSPRHLFSVIEDITEQVKMEEYLRVQEAKLIQSSKMSALGEMASGMAHEINNPLAIISASASIIKSKLTNKMSDLDLDSIKNKLFHIEKTIDRIAKIVKGLNAFARDSNQDPKSPCHASQIIEDTFELCQEKFKLKSIDFKISKIDDPQILVRSAQISQVLLNLLNNSFDAISDTQYPWVEICTKIDRQAVLISVIDSGKKITEEIQKKMMQPFFTTKDVGKGTGLGLSISQGIIEEHGGKFYYDPSSENTRFVIELPIYE